MSVKDSRKKETRKERKKERFMTNQQTRGGDKEGAEIKYGNYRTCFYTSPGKPAVCVIRLGAWRPLFIYPDDRGNRCLWNVVTPLPRLQLPFEEFRSHCVGIHCTVKLQLLADSLLWNGVLFRTAEREWISNTGRNWSSSVSLWGKWSEKKKSPLLIESFFFQLFKPKSVPSVTCTLLFFLNCDMRSPQDSRYFVLVS